METKIDKPNEPSQTGEKQQKKTNYNVSYKVPVILARFLIKLEFSGHISEKYSYQISWKSV